ncbi:DUF2188 domain-containing protein [Paenibacillus alba]|uniref:DUF2188 domain-containing protein n=1 Tax=Paenibacillus alba TaxID=1197127 RepID=A0ABU6FZD7_9BACL|nr:DUF2188 domain-containing protein [Paenibacillus alba]MEC0227269.1 DUF2188 domain-containing protein [Paenibacillus alba]
MPWTKSNYPESLKNFESRTRNKAVEIANALLEEGYEEGRAIAIATAQAKEWARDHPQRTHANKDEEMRGAGHLHVVPLDGKWAIKIEGTEDPKFVAGTKSEAVKKAQEWASDENQSAIIHRKNGTVQTSYNYK